MTSARFIITFVFVCKYFFRIVRWEHIIIVRQTIRVSWIRQMFTETTRLINKRFVFAPFAHSKKINLQYLCIYSFAACVAEMQYANIYTQFRGLCTRAVFQRSTTLFLALFRSTRPLPLIRFKFKSNKTI